MSKVVNLRQARKQRERAVKQADAAASAALHGRTKSQRRQDKAEEKLAERRLDGHKRDGD